MSGNPAADYAAALAALTASRAAIEAEFVEAKADRQSDPTDPDAKARYEAARDALQAMRAVDRADRSETAVGGDAVKES